MIPRAPMFEGGTLRDHGAVTGAWLLDRHGLTIPDHPPGAWTMVMVGRHAGRVVGARDTGGGTPAEPPASVAELLASLRVPEREEGRRRTRTLCRLVCDVDSMRDWPTLEGWPSARMRDRCREALPGRPDDGLLAAFRADVQAALDAVSPFLGTLDPYAVETLIAGRSLEDLDDDAYARLDPGFVPGAPLARLVRSMPGLLRTALGMASYRLPGGKVAHAPGKDGAELVEELTWRLTDNKLNTTEERVRRILAVGARFAALPARDRDRCQRLVPHSDPAHLLADALQALPRSWEPRTGNDWLGLVRCSRLVVSGLHLAGPDGLAAFVGGHGRWAELAARLAPLAQDDDGALEMTSLNDMAAAFAGQVVRPACPQLPPPVAVRAAFGLLFDGRGLHRMLGMAHRWHGRQAAILASLPQGGAAEWGAGLPDWSWRCVEVVVLRSSRELKAEGATGLDADGVQGLRHCVGGYAARCMSGTTRIVGSRMRAADGTVRLSTAEFDMRDGASLVQHRGARNAAPPVIAVQAMEAYAAALASGVLSIDRDGLLPTTHADRVSADAGYDVRAPGAAAACLEAWRPLLPRSLRAASMGDLATLVDGLDRSDARWWRPPGDRGLPAPVAAAPPP